MKSIINIIALIIICIGVLCIFFRREIFKEKSNSKVISVSGFVVSVIMLVVIFFVNR